MSKKSADIPASGSANAFKNDMPDRPLKRFLVAFGFGAPLIWITAAGYGNSSALQATIIAFAVSCVLGLIAAVGKRPLAWILNFFIHGGL